MTEGAKPAWGTGAPASFTGIAKSAPFGLDVAVNGVGTVKRISTTTPVASHTLSFDVYPVSLSARANMLLNIRATTPISQMSLSWDVSATSTQLLQNYSQTPATSNTTPGPKGPPLVVGQWNHVELRMSFEAMTVTLLLDGVAAAPWALSNRFVVTNPLAIGVGGTPTGPTETFHVIYDNVIVRAP